MKKQILIVVGLIALILPLSVSADTSYRVQIDDAVDRKNVTITHPVSGDKYLLYLGIGCGDLEAGQSVNLVIRGSLNYNNDYIKVDASHKCDIELAEKFNKKLYVDHPQGNRTQARLRTEEGDLYLVTYSSLCRLVSRYWRSDIYSIQQGNDLSQGDRLILPNKDGQCTVSYVQFISEEGESKGIWGNLRESGADKQKPTRVTNVKAIPHNGKVSLTWNRARDNKAVSHYMVSVNRHKIRTTDLDFEDVPNQMRVDGTKVTIEDLNNDEEYYFYVIAVDTSGNVSYDWSRWVAATPKSTILPDSTSSGERSLNLSLINESSKSFLMRWTMIPGAIRYSVILDADNRREFGSTDYKKRHIRILKKDSRKDKDLELTVRAYGVRGLIIEEVLDFNF